MSYRYTSPMTPSGGGRTLQVRGLAAPRATVQPFSLAWPTLRGVLLENDVPVTCAVLRVFFVELLEEMRRRGEEGRA